MVSLVRQCVIVLALAGAGLAAATAADPDPGDQLARVRVIVTTQAANVSLTVRDATIASYLSTALDGPASLTLSRTGRTLQLSRNVAGQSAEARFDIILADAVPGSALTWNVTADSSAETSIEVYSMADVNRATLVDRFAASSTSAQFVSSPNLIPSFNRVEADRFLPRLVLAFYYPWYTIETWQSSQLADRPVPRYSTEAQADVTRQAREARSLGIDAFVVSWQGLGPGADAGAGFNDRRMRLVLEAGRAANMKVCVYTETYVANPGSNPTAPIDPQTLYEWLSDIVDLYGSHPAYLRVGDRPVIFTYAASLFSQQGWADVIARLRTSGRNPFLVGDFSRSTLLEVFDGEYQYTNVFSSGDTLVDLNRTESLRVRTLNLLRERDRRRLWVASVTPGFDDSRIAGRTVPHVVDRANGSVYDQQWSSAIDTTADWIVVTSWNEWWENTHIEAGERFGRTYLDRTRVWAAAFKSVRRDRPILQP
jgi:glycoprotein endo-alpha-1,2-mannosidase